MRHLLTVGRDGTVQLGDVDSGAQVPVGDQLAEASGTRATTAAWSAVGQWTAWSLVSLRPGDPGEIRIHDEATNGTRVLAESLTAFYLCPSPCGRYLSHLSPGPLGLELGVSNVRSGELVIVERGQPLFWAWSPDSSRIAIHVSDRVLVSGADGSDATVVTDDAGSFIAPWWLPGGSFAAVVGDSIVGIGPDGTISPLVERAGTGRFAIDPDGHRLAMVDAVDGERRLVVVDLLTGQRDETGSDQVTAFAWSPDGERLAALEVASTDELRWLVHDGKELIRLPSFRPGRTWLATFVPFFEQYAQSHSMWSADGTQLVAIAEDADTGPVALVHHVDDPDAEERMDGADLAWWAVG